MKRLILGLVISIFCLPAYSTTVAYDGISLAADSQMTQGHRKLMTKSKIYYSSQRNQYIAAAGAVDVLTPVVDFFMKDTKPMTDCKIAGEFQVLIVDGATNTAKFYDHDMVSPIEVQAPFTFGSGDDFALAALICGKSAEEAIEVAEQLDIYSGGHINVMRVQKPIAALAR